MEKYECCVKAVAHPSGDAIVRDCFHVGLDADSGTFDGYAEDDSRTDEIDFLSFALWDALTKSQMQNVRTAWRSRHDLPFFAFGLLTRLSQAVHATLCQFQQSSSPRI